MKTQPKTVGTLKYLPPSEINILHVTTSQRSLPNPCIEVEIPLQAPEPIRRMIGPVNCGDGMRRHLDLNTVSPVQLCAVLPVEVH